MPETATWLGVKRNGWYDGRLDIIASTHAALNHLAYLRRFFDGNWLYAIAAYNTGEGNLLAAIKKNIRNGEDTDFWSLPVAQQTKDYVPSLLALAVILSFPDRYPMYFPPVKNAPYLAEVDIGNSINLKHAASLAGITHRKLRQLNSAYNQVDNAKKGPYKLILPIENVQQFAENLSQSPLAKPTINWQHYRVKAGDTLASIANKFDVGVGELRKLNQLSNNTIRKGTNLLIPMQTSFTSEPILASTEEIPHDENRNESISPYQKLASRIHTATKSRGKKYELQPGDTIYMIRRGDTIEKISKKFHTTPSVIRIANLLYHNSLIEGDRLVIPAKS
jgi:membrane-bound lytic murein transglycosylase D